MPRLGGLPGTDALGLRHKPCSGFAPGSQVPALSCGLACGRLFTLAMQGQMAGDAHAQGATAVAAA